MKFYADWRTYNTRYGAGLAKTVKNGHLRNILNIGYENINYVKNLMRKIYISPIALNQTLSNKINILRKNIVKKFSEILYFRK